MKWAPGGLVTFRGSSYFSEKGAKWEENVSVRLILGLAERAGPGLFVREDTTLSRCSQY